MAFRSPSRTADQLIKSRNAALKLKHGSPQFRDVIRQRCRNKVKENRQKFIDLLRNPSSGEELNQVLSATIQEELSLLSHKNKTDFEITNEMYIDAQLAHLDNSNESDLLEKIGVEICDAEVDQIMKSYDALVASDLNITQSLLDDDFIDIVECPICDKGHLILTEQMILCSNCYVIIFAQTSLVELRGKIYSSIVTHSQVCANKLNFFSVDNSLKVTCSACAHHSEIVF